MPSNNSYSYFNKFMEAVKIKYPSFDAVQLSAIRKLMLDIIDKSPSKTMGGSGYADEFVIGATRVMCSGQWCWNESCNCHCMHSVYNCGDKKKPSTCKEWRDWRRQRRSYPDNEACQECCHFKPDRPQVKGANEHRCMRRKKGWPDGCPKNPVKTEKQK